MLVSIHCKQRVTPPSPTVAEALLVASPRALYVTINGVTTSLYPPTYTALKLCGQHRVASSLRPYSNTHRHYPVPLLIPLDTMMLDIAFSGIATNDNPDYVSHQQYVRDRRQQLIKSHQPTTRPALNDKTMVDDLLSLRNITSIDRDVLIQYIRSGVESPATYPTLLRLTDRLPNHTTLNRILAHVCTDAPQTHPQ